MRRFIGMLPMILFAGMLPMVLGGCDTIITGNQTIAATTIGVGDRLVFDPNVSSTLTVTGNLIINGTLQMRPASPGVVHKIIFSTADESAFVGGGLDPIDSDVGLWVMGAGQLDLSGSVREPWGYSTGGLSAGATTLTLDRDPIGWRVTDELAVTPTAANDYTNFETPATITAISGRTVTIATPLSVAHPAVVLPDGRTKTPEIMNLTRNVQIAGKAPASPFPRAGQLNSPGRTHIFIRNTQPVVQTIDYTTIRYTGPRQYDPAADRQTSKYVLGRYGLHFHMAGNNNAGTTVTGTVVRNSGSHAFVPHMSNGITFEKDIAYSDAETPFWWDTKANEEGFINNDSTNNITYSNSIAANISTDSFRGSLRLAGFSTACGSNNSIVNSVATGIQAGTQSSGIFWPEGGNSCPNTWTVDDDLAHNNNGDGIFTWANDSTDPHNLTHRFTSYRNDGACLEHGAYVNRFQYLGATCFDDAGTSTTPTAAITMHAGGYAATATLGPLEMDDFRIASTRVVSAVRFVKHLASTSTPANLRRWNISGYTGAAVTIAEPADSLKAAYDLVCWTLPSNAELQPTDFNIAGIVDGSVYRVQRRDGTAFKIARVGGTTTTSTIPGFSGC